MKKQRLNLLLPDIKSARFRRSRILVIEDDLNLCEILREVFSQSGYESLIVQETIDIDELMGSFKPDLVLLDYLLPRINGGELCSQVKQNDKFAHTPVIIYSAYPKVLLSLGDYKCDYFLPKPFDLDELVRKMELLLLQPIQRLRFCTAAIGLQG